MDGGEEGNGSFCDPHIEHRTQPLWCHLFHLQDRAWTRLRRTLSPPVSSQPLFQRIRESNILFCLLKRSAAGETCPILSCSLQKAQEQNVLRAVCSLYTWLDPSSAECYVPEQGHTKRARSRIPLFLYKEKLQAASWHLSAIPFVCFSTFLCLFLSLVRCDLSRHRNS